MLHYSSMNGICIFVNYTIYTILYVQLDTHNAACIIFKLCYTCTLYTASRKFIIWD